MDAKQFFSMENTEARNEYLTRQIDILRTKIDECNNQIESLRRTSVFLHGVGLENLVKLATIMAGSAIDEPDHPDYEKLQKEKKYFEDRIDEDTETIREMTEKGFRLIRKRIKMNRLLNLCLRLRV